MGRSLPRSGVRLVAEDYNRFIQQLNNAERSLLAFQRTAQRQVDPRINTNQLRSQLRQLETDSRRTGGRSGNAFGSAFGSGITGVVGAGFFLGLGGIGANAFVNAFAAGLRGLGGLIADSAGLEQNLVNIVSISGVDITNAQEFSSAMGQVRESIERVATAPTLNVGADTAAAAAEALLKTGQSIEDVNSSLLEQAIVLQNAAGTTGTLDEYNRVSDALGRSIALFGVAAEEADRVSNAITGVITGSSIKNITDYQFALNNSAGAISVLDLSMEEFNATLVGTSKNFSTGRTQATALSSALTKLANPTEDSAQALKDLGIQAFDIQGNFVGLESLSNQLRQAMERGFSQEELLNLLSRGFGAVGAEAAVALGNVEDFSQALDQVTSTNALDIAAAKTTTLSARFANLRDQVGFLGIAIAGPFTESLNPAVESAQGLVAALNDDFTRLGESIGTLTLPAINGLVDAIDALAVRSGSTNADALLNSLDAQIAARQGAFAALDDISLVGDLFTGNYASSVNEGVSALTSLRNAIEIASDETADGVIGIDAYRDRLAQLTQSAIASGGQLSGGELAEVAQLYRTISSEIEETAQSAVEAGTTERQQLTETINTLRERALAEFEGRAVELAPEIGDGAATELFNQARDQLTEGLAQIEADLASQEIFVGPEVNIAAGELIGQLREGIITAVDTGSVEPITVDVPILLSESLSNFSGLGVGIQEEFAGVADGLFNLQSAFAATGSLTEQQQAQLIDLATTTAVLSQDSLNLATAYDVLAQSETFAGTGASELLGAMVTLDSQYRQNQVGVSEYGLALQGLVNQLMAVVTAAGITDSAVLGVIGSLQNAANVAADSVTAAGGNTPGAAAASDARVEAAALRQQRRQRRLLADAQSQSARASSQAAKSGAQALKNAESALGQIEGLFSLSKVSGEDLLAAQNGEYVDKADEFVRQLADFVENGNTEFSGRLDEARAALARVGVTADDPQDVLAKIRDGWANQWLFAAEENVRLINGVAIEAALAMKEKSEIGRQNIIAAFGGLVDANVEAIERGLSGGAVGGGTAPEVPTQDDLDAQIGTLDFTYLEDVLASSLTLAITGGFAAVDFGAIIGENINIGEIGASAAGTETTPLEVSDFWEFALPEPKISLSIYDYWEVPKSDQKALIDLAEAVQFSGAAGAARIDLSRSVNFTGAATSQIVDLSGAVNFTGAAGSRNIDLSTIVDFVGQLPSEEIDRAELVDFINAIPAEDVDRAGIIDLLGQYPNEQIDRQSLIGFINELPSEDVDRQTLITFANALPSEDIDRQALINFVNELPSEQIDRTGLIGFINELPSEEVDRQSIIEFINTIPVEEIDLSQTITFAGTIPSRNVDLGELVTYSGDPAVTPPISTSGTAGVTTVTAGEPLPVIVENADALDPNSSGFTGSEKFSLDDVEATGTTTITGPVTFPDNEEQRDIIRENERLIELADDILENWDELIAAQSAATTPFSDPSSSLINANTEGEIAKLQALGNEASLTRSDVDTLGEGAVEAAGDIADAGEDLVDTFDDVSETSGTVIEELRGWEGALNSSTGKIDAFAETLDALDFSDFESSLDELVSAVREAASKIAGAVDGGGGGDDGGGETAPEATGGASMLGGLANGRTLVGEDGPELWYNPFSHESGIVGGQGAQIVNFDPGTHVVPADETRQVLSRSGGTPSPEFMSAQNGIFDTGLTQDELQSLFSGTPPGIPSGGIRVPRERERSPDASSDRFRSDDSFFQELQQQISDTQNAVAGLFNAAGSQGGVGSRPFAQANNRGVAERFANIASGNGMGITKPGDTTINIVNNNVIDNSVRTTTNNYALTTRSLRSTESVEADFRISRNQAR